jgi:hypothetical protein
MKLQILDEGLDLNKDGEQSISFLNKLEIGIRTMLMNPGSIPRPLFHFLMRLPQRRTNYPRRWFHFLTSLKLENYAQVWFHFLKKFKIRKSCSKTYVSFFKEVSLDTQNLSS